MALPRCDPLLSAPEGEVKMPCYTEFIYNRFWFSPKREMLQALINKS